MTKPTLTVLIGAAGSGKSTYAAAHWKPSQIVSSDHLREVVSDDPANQLASSDAFVLLRQIVEMRLCRGLDTVVDATSSHAGHRAALLGIAQQEGARPRAVVMATPLAECQARNARRSFATLTQEYARRVPENVIKDQHERILGDLGNLYREGFSEVEYIGTGTPDLGGPSGVIRLDRTAPGGSHDG